MIDVEKAKANSIDLLPPPPQEGQPPEGQGQPPQGQPPMPPQGAM